MRKWHKCKCPDHANNVAIVTTAFMVTPEPWQVEFVRKHRGKFVCFDCGGEVSRNDVDTWDRKTASSVTERLRELGVLIP